MTDDIWLRVRAAFDAVLDAPPDQRDAALSVACAGDEAVRREVIALLARESGGFLDAGPQVALDRAILDPQFAPGTEIGGYRIVGRIGQGGMGEVYEGLRLGHEFQRRVAIKVLRAGWHGVEAVHRFERERRILAGLEHHNIAALYDGGVLPDGRPYLVMEFVEGERITDWCASHHLDVAARLTLFRQICSAVSEAHRNLIVHRDIKPGNILVTTDGTVKLLDFGIAKVLRDEATPEEATTLTGQGAAALTPEYAAPEQFTGAPVTTATDVYALGLLLFELLSGSRPFARTATSLPEMARLVLTTEAPLASATVNTARVGIDGNATRRALRGDLDAIVGKALRTIAAERYRSVDQLADDLRRHEQGLPVDAMRGQRGYRMRKFAVRNRGILMAATVVGIAIVAGAVATWQESRRTAVQRSRAEATNRFLTGMLSAVDPEAAGKEVPMVTVLDTAATRIASDTTIEPEVEASLRTAIGVSYRSLGKYAQAEPHLRRALALRERHPEQAVPLAEALRELARWHDDRGEYPVADSLYKRALGVLPTRGDSVVTGLVTDLLGQRARMQSLSGDLPGAARTLAEVAARQRAQYGEVSQEAAVAISQLGVTYTQQGSLAPAESTERAALAIFRQLHKPPHPDIAKTLGRLATALDQEGKRAAADTAYRESLRMLAVILGPSHSELAWVRYNYSGFLLDGKQWDEAIIQADSVLQYRGSSIPPTHPAISGTMYLRSLALAGRGDHAAAQQGLRDVLALRRTYLPPTHWIIGSSESVLGNELLHGGSRAEAIQLMTDGCRIIVKALGPDHPSSKKALERLTNAGAPAAACR